ncbi:hypothetical protein DMENIID0001_111200 [Sergentomyia squamirostris]
MNRVSIALFIIIGLVCEQLYGYESYIPTYFPDTSEEGMGLPLFLTPYIHAGDVETAQELALVQHPKMDFFTSYSGFLTVDKQYNSNLFFWYVKAQENSDEAPVIIWLAGGPGFTTFYAFFYENGPFYLTPELDFPPREYSWHIDHNIIFIDNPVGTGFSFTESEEGYSTNSEHVAVNLYEALQQFFTLFPHLRSNSFFICAESFGAQYAAFLGPLIHERNADRPKEEFINLRGISIGNGAINFGEQMTDPAFLYQLGFIDAKTAESVALEEEYIHSLARNGDYKEAGRGILNLFIANDSKVKEATGLDELYNFVTAQDDIYVPMLKFLSDVSIRKAIHVGGVGFYGVENNPAESHLYHLLAFPVTDKISEILSYYPLLLYSGQLDLEITYSSMEKILRKLDFKDCDEYLTARRHSWRVDGTVAGYVKQGGLLTEVLVRNSGHMAPLEQPKWCLNLILKLTYEKAFV